MIPQEVIRLKRNGESLPPGEIYEFIKALAEDRISEGQVAAFAMAVWFNGMSAEETVALTLAMRDSGDVLSWDDLGRPVGDKHSTGGIGDNVSLMLAPIVAVCGLAVPMISGRGLGHTGGTLDKLESIPGFNVTQSADRFREIVRQVGCAIVGQTARIAPADKRLYAIRDVTATVDSIPLITGSILSKKLAAGLQSLTMDVKTGSGAFMESMEEAEVLARSIVDVANGAGVKTSALITDMNEPLADCAGNAVEVVHAMEFLAGGKSGTRSHEVVMAFASHMLVNAGLADNLDVAAEKATHALSSGKAMELFGKMVAAQGGPVDFAESWKKHLPTAPVVKPIVSPRGGHVSAFRTRDIGLAVIGLGGGRTKPDEKIDHCTGFSGIKPIGSKVEAGERLAFVHAASEDAAGRAIADYLNCVTIADAPVMRGPSVLKLVN